MHRSNGFFFPSDIINLLYFITSLSAFELYLCLNLKVHWLQLQCSELLKMEVRKSSVLYPRGLCDNCLCKSPSNSSRGNL